MTNLNDMTSSEINNWSNERGTSNEIGRAIFRLSEFRHEHDLDGERDVQKIWEAPYGDEDDIMDTAWSLTDDDEEFLYWGESTHSRP